jgi:hypothetical protein
MSFEFIILHLLRKDEPILGVLRDRLREALESNLNDVEEDALLNMVWTNFQRPQPTADDGARRAVLGFSLELPAETASIREVVDEFTDALMDDPITHVVKCEDPLLRTELATRAAELFALEMKLRRVLSIIYLHAYPDGDPYDLLCEEAMQPMATPKPQKEQMMAAAENQFFHLTFGQYVGLNQRPAISAIRDLTSIIRNEETYESFRTELLRQPIEHEDDAGFLAGLKERMDAIEKMRNAVAHNRCPPRRTNEAYINALPLVNQALDNYLGALSLHWNAALIGDTGMPWNSSARRAASQRMEQAEWDESTMTITLHDPEEPRSRKSVSSRDELTQHLESIASSAFYAECPRDEGEFLYTCDSYGIVEDVLSAYDERLLEFFGGKRHEIAT